MTVLAIVPARGGSKGVPRKNLRQVSNRSLLQRAIESAKSSRIDRILVSTDDLEIRQAALEAGAEVPFLRPSEYANDHASTVDAVASSVSSFEKWSNLRVSTIVLLEPTSPFRTLVHVETAILQMASGCYRSVVSVCPLDSKPENIFVKRQNLEKYIRDPDERFVRRQDMNHLCRINSAIYVIGRDDFFRERRLILDPVGWIEMSCEESINIDSKLDLELAEVVAQRL